MSVKYVVGRFSAGKIDFHDGDVFDLLSEAPEKLEDAQSCCPEENWGVFAFTEVQAVLPPKAS